MTNVYADFRNSDDHVPFYVGIGDARRVYRKKRNDIHAAISAKNPEWHRVVLVETTTREDAMAIEMQLVSYFGRIDIGTGVLANMTEGGEAITEFGPDAMRAIKTGATNAGVAARRNGTGIFSQTPEQRKELGRKVNAKLTPEQRSEWSRKASAAKTPAQRKAGAIKSAAVMTPEARVARALKSAATVRKRKFNVLTDM